MPRQATIPAPPPIEVIHIGVRKRLLSSLLYAAATILRCLNWFRRSQENRIIVLEPVGLGDLISFEPLVRELLQREYEVVLCAKPEWRPLFRDSAHLKWVDLRLPWASHNEQIKYQISRYLQEPVKGDLRNMRAAGRGAIGIDTRGDIRSVLLLYWVGCKRVISLSNYLGSDLPMSRWAAEIVPFDNCLRRWELNALFLRELDPRADLPAIDPPRLAHLIDRSRPKRAALLPIAPWEGKLWPRERWMEVASQLRAAGWEVVGLCGPKQKTAAEAQVGSSVPLIECGSIESWAREFNQCAFVITVDSGPMHLADALQVPVIALFGQGKLPLWAPSGKKSVVIVHRDEEFFVCHPIVANTHLGQKYMNRITVGDVLDAVNRINGGGPGSGPSSIKSASVPQS